MARKPTAIRRTGPLAIFCWVSLVALSGPAEAADVMHYVRIDKPMSLSGGMSARAGSEIAIQYDAGDGWIPGFSTVLPFLAKDSATLIDEIVFDPPVTGRINKLTPLYLRAYNNGSIASSVVPSTDGTLLKKGDSVKVVRREGNYFVVDAKYFSQAMVPVALVDASEIDLGRGRVEPVPSYQGHANASQPSKPRVGQLFGQLKIPYRYDDKELAEGNYVPITFDAGNYWVLAGFSWQSSPRISKDAVDLVPRVEYDTPLIGRITTPTTVYKFSPDVGRAPESLEQGESFANLNPSIRVGDHVEITAREGTDYIIDIPGRNFNDRGRVPVSVVEITAGNPESGGPVTIPPLPQSTNASAPGYFPPPPPKADPDAWFTDYVVPFMVFSVLLAIAGAVSKRRINTLTARPGEADYGVPHTNFVRTPDGFRVTFSRNSDGFYKATHSIQQIKGGGSPAAAIGAILAMILGIFFILIWYGIEGFRKTVIIVDRESVTINGKVMSRSDFGNFVIDHSLTLNEGQVAVLGFQFGNRTFPFGGVWEDRQAQEVASSLNSHLRMTPLAGDQHNPSPEALRVARPTDF